MEVLDTQLQKKVRAASKKLGMDEQELVNHAVSQYLHMMEGAKQLKQELRMWDVLAAKSMRAHGF
ncbi:hypothetical protein FJY93_00590 [Candidatus Kaiserbacteria bacterium]|nr:hypothetical protein [Candidatus Kaiserbacteria bacterium]